MANNQTIGIIGAGVSGLVAAKTCIEYGFTVKVFEKDSELGGVWSTSRRYPGIQTQNTKDTYCFTDFAMPGFYPQWPGGKQVQTYLSAYANRFGVFPFIRFSHEVISVDFIESKWRITGLNSDGAFAEHVDFLIVGNGTFSTPYMPEIPGMGKFTEGGGKIFHSSEFNDLHIFQKKRVVVVGYGKSATDLATEISHQSLSTHIVFREAKWKLPRYIKGINSKYLFINRLGESFIKPEDWHNGIDRLVHKLGIGRRMLAFAERYMTRTQHLKELNLVPNAGVRDFSFGELALETPGFFNKIKGGDIVAIKAEVHSFDNGSVLLTNGESIDCDLVVFAVGFQQQLSFLPNRFKQRLIDDKGNYRLYRHILPARIPNLAFIGYNSSIQCTLSSEFAALWICEYLKGRISKPSDDLIEQEADAFIKWRSQFRQNGAISGLSTMPGTIHHVDQLLKDMGTALPFMSLVPDWLVMSDPKRYRSLRKKIISRNK